MTRILICILMILVGCFMVTTDAILMPIGLCLIIGGFILLHGEVYMVCSYRLREIVKWIKRRADSLLMIIYIIIIIAGGGLVFIGGEIMEPKKPWLMVIGYFMIAIGSLLGLRHANLVVQAARRMKTRNEGGEQ